MVKWQSHNYDTYGSIVLGPGFSSKHGSIFRAYVFTNPNMCGNFTYRTSQKNITSESQIKEPRPIITTKRATTEYKTTTGNENNNPIITLYPNPTNTTVNYDLNYNSQFTYTVCLCVEYYYQ